MTDDIEALIKEEEESSSEETKENTSDTKPDKTIQEQEEDLYTARIKEIDEQTTEDFDNQGEEYSSAL